MKTPSPKKDEEAAKQDVPVQPVLPKKPTLPPVFKRPVINTFSPGSKIRQDQRRQFFSRTRRGI